MESSTAQLWEEAGASLAVSLRKYLDLSVSFGTTSLKEGVPPKAIAAQIDAVLESLHTKISGQIYQAQSTLTRTRNHLLSPIYRLPDEVLAEVFSNVIFPPPDLFDSASMTRSLVNMYRLLHNLASVSHMWRSVALSQGGLWSTVPIVHRDYSPFSFRFKQATNLSLTRATHGDLYLAAILDSGYRLISSLMKHASRFRTINITAQSRYSINSLLQSFLKLDSAKRLCELSLRSEAPPPKLNELILDKDHLFPLHSEDRKHFDKLIEPLSAVRICGVQIHWSQMVFSKQLVELHLQDITLGYDAVMAALLGALASATELRDLKLISVNTFIDMQMLDAPTAGPLILPKLETLLLQDLYNNTLTLVLPAITSRSHNLTLHLTRKCVQGNIPGHLEPEEIGIDDLYDPIEHTPVHALLIDGDGHETWISPDELENIMSLMSDLVSLGMNSWVYTTSFCRALERPPRGFEGSYPKIEYMHFSWARILNEQAFKQMVASHEFLEEMKLGAAVPSGLEGPEGWIYLEDDAAIMRWLEQRVDIFLQMDYDHYQPEFLPPKWKLW
ncbi:unnamed protein product [Rhizoctonia solani]|uniref:F-box domain-containing protein n=1 Tax=Rhizoctonia solani TaxID=456999 RepID=A0A8H3E8F6_9AGAM|nr:unnamed protein product [Rhizoctonia solani]